jgi:selenide,water dikinase
MTEELKSQHVVLLGIGHTNAHVLRMWRMNPIANADLTCISDFGVATYSGMLPAVLAGQIDPERMQIDLRRLCAASNARLLVERVIGIDHQQRCLLFADRPPVPFDVLSIGIGSMADRSGVEVRGRSLIEIKPMQTFLPRLADAIARATAQDPAGELRIVVVGGGVASVEITACLPAFMRRHTKRPFQLALVTQHDRLLSGLAERTREKIVYEFQQREVTIVTGQPVSQVTESSIGLADGVSIAADLVIWATHAVAPPLLNRLGLELDDRGFIATRQTLQSISAERIFAVGDAGTIRGESLPKAGVYAVRQGPVLWDNIQRSLDRRPLQTYRPQRSFLKLINMGDGRAVGQWRGISFSGSWAMRWKGRIDAKFMDRFEVQPMDANDEPMQCRGCGCKLGTESLQTALHRVGLPASEDAVAIGGANSGLLASTDFFSAPVDDAFLAGRIAAIHAASDIIVSGGRPTEALANLVLPAGDLASQQRLLHDLLAGAQREFHSLGAAIVGGHTIVGPRLETGFTVVGRLMGDQPIRKNKLQIGDHLWLTKPLGVGVLLAAHMRCRCRSAWYDGLLETMLQPQFEYARIAHDLGIVAATDVTGFGLAGHLIEMLVASRRAAELHLDRIPILDGAAELIAAGVESSLTPANRAVEKQIACTAEQRQRSVYQLLFDPQTCGGLLFGVPEQRGDEFVSALQAANLPAPTDIGQVTFAAADHPRLRLL